MHVISGRGIKNPMLSSDESSDIVPELLTNYGRFASRTFCPQHESFFALDR